MTVLATLLPELEAKSLQLLAEVVPGLKRVCILLNPDDPPHTVDDAEAAAKLVGLHLVSARARRPEDFPVAFATMVAAHVGAVDVWGDPMFSRLRPAVSDLALKSRVPTMFKTKPEVAAGGLIRDGSDVTRKPRSQMSKTPKAPQPVSI